MPSFASIWYRPKEIIRQLQQCTWSDYQLMLMLAFVYFVQIGTFILSLEKITIAPLFSWDGVKLIVLFFVMVGFQSFVIIYAAALLFWASAKLFGGQGTLPQTRGAVIWTQISTLPIGFFLLLLYCVFRNPDLGFLASVIKIVSFVGIIGSLIYGFIVLLKTMGQTQRLTPWPTFFATVLGLIALAVILFASRAYIFY